MTGRAVGFGSRLGDNVLTFVHAIAASHINHADMLRAEEMRGAPPSRGGPLSVGLRPASRRPRRSPLVTSRSDAAHPDLPLSLTSDLKHQGDADLCAH